MPSRHSRVAAATLAAGCLMACGPSGETQATADSSASATRSEAGASADAVPNACALLTASEIAKALAVPSVFIDSLNSGRHEFKDVDLCSWGVAPNDPRGVMVKLRRAKSSDEIELTLTAARVDDSFGDPATPPSAVAGLGDEAVYRDYADKQGGVLIVRRGLTVFTLDGSRVTKAALIALAKVALPRA